MTLVGLGMAVARWVFMPGSALSAPLLPAVRYSHPASAGALVWCRAPGRYALTAIVKTTFELVSGGVATLAEHQVALSGDESSELAERLTTATDWVPSKPRCDVGVIGFAHAHATTERVDVAVQVDALHRRLHAAPQQLVEGLAPLSAATRAASSPARRAAFEWSQGLMSSLRPAPPEADFSFFNAAPSDMQLDHLGDETLVVLEGLLPGRPRFASRLPRYLATASVQSRSGTMPIALRADTLWIDATARIATVTWRGACDLHGHPEDVRAVSFDVHPVVDVPRPPDSSPTSVLSDLATAGSSHPPPPSSGTWSQDEPYTSIHAAAPSSAPLPFVGGHTIAPPRYLDEPFAIEDSGTVDNCRDLDDSLGALPFVAPVPAQPAEEAPPVMTVEAWARLTARLDLHPNERERVLREAKVDESGRSRAHEHWRRVIAEEGRNGITTMLERHDESYVAALEQERGELSLGTYALLSVAAERHAVTETASALHVPERALLIIDRLWNRRLLSDATLRLTLRQELKRARHPSTAECPPHAQQSPCPNPS